MQLQTCKAVLPEFHVVHVVKSHVVNVVSGRLLVQIAFRLFITRFLLEINKFWSDLLAKLYRLLKLHLNLSTEKRREEMGLQSCVGFQLSVFDLSLHARKSAWKFQPNLWMNLGTDQSLWVYDPNYHILKKGMTNDTESMTLIRILELEHILWMKNSGVIYLCPNLCLNAHR